MRSGERGPAQLAYSTTALATISDLQARIAELKRSAKLTSENHPR
jgi:hypothetical protein